MTKPTVKVTNIVRTGVQTFQYDVELTSSDGKPIQYSEIEGIKCANGFSIMELIRETTRRMEAE